MVLSFLGELVVGPILVAGKTGKDRFDMGNSCELLSSITFFLETSQKAATHTSFR